MRTMHEVAIFFTKTRARDKERYIDMLQNVLQNMRVMKILAFAR